MREIARRTEVPVGSLHRELKTLADAGVLVRTPMDNQVRYQADTQCPIFEQLAGIFRPRERSYRPRREPALPLKAAESPAVYARAADVAARRSRSLDRLNVSPRVLRAFCRRHHLSKLSFFGSVTRDDFRADSDADVLVEFLPQPPRKAFDMVDMRDELSALFGGRKVDVVTTSVFRNPLRRTSIERDLVPAYEAG